MVFGSEALGPDPLPDFLPRPLMDHPASVIDVGSVRRGCSNKCRTAARARRSYAHTYLTGMVAALEPEVRI